MRAMPVLLLFVLWLGCSDGDVRSEPPVVEVEQQVAIEEIEKIEVQVEAVESEPESQDAEASAEPALVDESEVPPLDVVWSKFIDHRLRIEEILESGEFIYLEELDAVEEELQEIHALERELAISARQISELVGLRVARAVSALEDRRRWASNAATRMQSPRVLRQALQEFDYWLYQMEEFLPEGTLTRSISDHITIEQIARDTG